MKKTITNNASILYKLKIIFFDFFVLKRKKIIFLFEHPFLSENEDVMGEIHHLESKFKKTKKIIVCNTPNNQLFKEVKELNYDYCLIIKNNSPFGIHNKTNELIYQMFSTKKNNLVYLNNDYENIDDSDILISLSTISDLKLNQVIAGLNTNYIKKLDCFTLTIILNVHQEGALLEKTICNIKDIINHEKKLQLWDRVEIIAILDNVDLVTKNIIEKHKNIFNTISLVYYGDPAKSRSHGIKIAKNNFIQYADGDDYFSDNLLVELFLEAYKHYCVFEDFDAIPDEQHIAIFPKVLLVFPGLHIQVYTDSNDIIKQNMKFSHCFTSRLFCHRKILSKINWRENINSYGFEDWDLNNRLLSHGLRFKTANYILYYRNVEQRESSVFFKHKQKNSMVRNSSLYKILPPKQNTRFKKLCSKNEFIINTNLFLNLSNLTRFLKIKNENILDSNQFTFASCATMNETFIPEVNYYNYLTSILEKCKTLFVFMNKESCFNDDFIKTMSSNAVSEDIVVIINDQNYIGNDNLNEIIPFKLLDFEKKNSLLFSTKVRSHIYLKAIINSRVKRVIIYDEDPSILSLISYQDCFQEHEISIQSRIGFEVLKK